jgi:hypothetical protein
MKYWLVRQKPYARGHKGPFSTLLDAQLAREIGTRAWYLSKVMSQEEFDASENSE